MPTLWTPLEAFAALSLLCGILQILFLLIPDNRIDDICFDDAYIADASLRPCLAVIGGSALSKLFEEHDLEHNLVGTRPFRKSQDSRYKLVIYATEAVATDICESEANAFLCKLPQDIVVPRLTNAELRQLCANHGIPHEGKFDNKPQLLDRLANHTCENCPEFLSVIVPNRLASAAGIRKELDDPCQIIKSVLRPFSLADFATAPVVKGTMPSTKTSTVALAGIYRGAAVDDLHLDAHSFLVCLPVNLLVHKLTVRGLRALGGLHRVTVLAKDTRAKSVAALLEHCCNPETCVPLFGCFNVVKPIARAMPEPNPTVVNWMPFSSDSDVEWPPKPIGKEGVIRIAREYTNACQPSSFEEAGCQVCGQLKLLTTLTEAREVNLPLASLVQRGVTRKERLCKEDAHEDLPGPVLDYTAEHICDDCLKYLRQGRRPPNALANGTWIGEVPAALQGLTLAEQLLIARLRRNRCVVKVTSGHSKMVANVIAFDNPVAKIYDKLPLHSSQLDDVLAFVFTGVSPPTQDDLKRTPMFVRRNTVRKALAWLKLNHCDYFDVEISEENLSSYPEEGIAVAPIYNTLDTEDASNHAAQSVFDNGEEAGTKTGRCPYRVNGLTGERIHGLSVNQRKSIIAKHLKQGGHVLAVGHGEVPASIFSDPQYYPKMFPWLFPYSLGGVGNTHVELAKINEGNHLKLMLMYHDKRFQMDSHFVIVAFNVSQVKKGTSGSFLVAKRKNFKEIARQIKMIHLPTLNSLSERMEREGHVEARNEREKHCFKLLNGINLVGGHVQGSLTSKKYMRGELWSLTNFLGAPSWFVTISPSDTHHPLCLYWADTGLSFTPQVLSASQREALISANPVACARFFHFLVELFIKYVLQCDGEMAGAFGETAGYYGVVEQQGRMTLHLHMLLYIKGAWSPQQIRERLMSEDSEFQTRLFDYLESCSSGGFRTGSREDVEDRRILEEQSVLAEDNDRAVLNDPSDRWPEAPPLQDCPNFPGDCICDTCQELHAWYARFEKDIDDLVIRCNVHRRCWARKDNGPENDADGTKKHATGKGCLNRQGQCTARFPRPVVSESKVDTKDGHVEIKKTEEWINNITELVTWSNRCNTDTTSLLSGTAVKATLGYVSDYVVKLSLKTYQILTAAFNIFERNPELVEDKSTDSARKLILKVLNSLMTKMEIGAPMAAMYLLGNPDRYTSHTFVPFYWRNFVNRAVATASDPRETLDEVNVNEELQYVDEDEEQVLIARSGGMFVGRSNIDDYTMRPNQYEMVNLYEWTQCHVKVLIKNLPKDCSNYYPFRQGHPLHKSHWVTCIETRRYTHVPNFIGAGFPRRETNDKDFYTATMLSLFKPWRTGEDLKGGHPGWSQAFDSYAFTDNQRRLMDNFNLRYECYDAKDDFRQQVAKQGNAVSGGFYAPGDNTSTTISDTKDSGDDTTSDYVEGRGKPMPSINPDKGCEYLERINQRRKAQAVLEEGGWNPNFDGAALTDNHFDSLLVEIPSNITPKEWKDTVEKERSREMMRRVTAAAFIATREEEKRRRLANLGDRVFSAPGAFISKEFKPIEPEKKNRAFSIVANHSLEVAPQQLLMYIGGMAGSGKTRVLNTLIRWFTSQNERAKLALLAPTGTAASQIGGSTYHHYLGIQAFEGGRMRKPSRMAMDDARARMKAVEYIFLDEISMVGCEELYNIGHMLQEITGRRDAPFGGINMIFAGDFAQLPPPGGVSLYSGSVELNIAPRQKGSELNRSLGKASWHQVSTVVMLKANMRQTEKTNDDERLRVALNNIRFKSATETDIAFLKSRMPEYNPEVTLDCPKFRFCSVITAWNSYRDEMNEAKAAAFARSIGQPLHRFYSIDRYRVEDSDDNVKRTKRKYIRRPFDHEDQQMLWEQAPGVSDQTAGVLSICLGMPVVVRNNDATELSITKGQEGEVVGWVDNQHPYYKDKKVLETLFVRLLTAKFTVPIEGLPDGVVPLTRISSSIEVQVPSDEKTPVQREQVPVLLNFAMTDFASQGKTREYNVVDLSNLRNHQAVYTALSRGTKAENTLILGPLKPKLITGGLDGYLRGEFRDMNYLDEITRLQFEGQLPIDWPENEVRERRIARYRRWCQNQSSVESNWHPALRVSTSATPKDGNKRKADKNGVEWENSKRIKRGDASNTAVRPLPMEGDVNLAGREGGGSLDRRPVGLKWDSRDHSCAFDASITLLYNLWQSNRDFWSSRMGQISALMQDLVNLFPRAIENVDELNRARDELRGELRRRWPGAFVWGGTD